VSQECEAGASRGTKSRRRPGGAHARLSRKNSALEWVAGSPASTESVNWRVVAAIPRARRWSGRSAVPMHASVTATASVSAAARRRARGDRIVVDRAAGVAVGGLLDELAPVLVLVDRGEPCLARAGDGERALDRPLAPVCGQRIDEPDVAPRPEPGPCDRRPQ